MTTFVQDTFTDTNGVALTAHVGETGATWTKHPNAGAGVPFTINANRIYPVSTSEEHPCYASGVPSSADYTVTAVLRRIGDGSSHTTAIAARMSTSANTYYFVYVSEFDTPNSWHLTKLVAGVETDLDTFVGDNSVATDYTVAFTLDGDALSVTINTVERLTATDSAITAAGRVGVGGFGSPSDPTNFGWHIDSLLGETVDQPNAPLVNPDYRQFPKSKLRPAVPVRY